MKVGLIIVNKSSNYGALLQSLATQKYIEQMGCETEIIRCKTGKGTKELVHKVLRHCVPVVYKTSLRSVKKRNHLKKNDSLERADDLRNKQGEFFVQEKLHSIVTYESVEQLRGEVENRYSTVLIGSDQQWTPQCFYNEINTLAFVPEAVNKVSYATSMGVSQLPWYTVSRVNKYVSRIQSVSVREKTAKEILQRITKRNDIQVVPDPTFLLEKKDWDVAIPYKEMDTEEYIFCYFLSNSGVSMKAANEFAEKFSLKIYAVRNVEVFEEDRTNYGNAIVLDAPSVEDFVNYIRNAKFVFTDSFHGTVFSLINKVQFVTYYRFSNTDSNSRNSRVDDLLETLGLQSRISSKKRCAEEIIREPINYKVVETKIDEMRLRGRIYLKCAIK